MQTILLVFQIFIAIALVGVILMQRNTGDGLSGLGGGGGGNSFMSGRASADALTKLTMILAAVFMINSLVLAKLSSTASVHKSIVDVPVSESPKTPAKPSVPSAQ